MRWTLAEIETFLAVIEAGSISAAAARANRTRRARLREPRCPNRHPKKGAP